MQAGHKKHEHCSHALEEDEKHEHCSHALEEDAPKVLGHGSISEWAVMATEHQTPWSAGGYLQNGGNKILSMN